ncbi:hypothetical protein [Parafrigoribacterium soli]|uniref:hypothetical protein n=1 Tax=Parafrigoribacterium soli TaxID=3144663 RepID=UPI0032EC56DA
MLPQACTAIGWINTATVTLKGAVQKVHTVQLCIDETCSVAAGELQQQDEPLQRATAIPDAQGPAPTSAPIAIPPIEVRVDDHNWTFQVGMSAPKTMTVRANSADGTVLAEREVSRRWTRVGGTEQCGGPAEAAPVTLSIPD